MKSLLFAIALLSLAACEQATPSSQQPVDETPSEEVFTPEGQNPNLPPVQSPDNGRPAAPPKGLVYDKVGVGADGYDSPLKFAQIEHYWGNVKKGEKVTVDYPAKNVSNSTIEIEKVMVSCDCMIPEYPKGPIHPGEEIIIRGTFDSKNQLPMQYEKIFSVKVKGNDIPQALWLKGMVVQ